MAQTQAVTSASGADTHLSLSFATTEETHGTPDIVQLSSA